MKLRIGLTLAASGALALTAASALAPGGPAAWAASDNTPVITVADGNSVIAFETSENGLRFYWNEHGTNNWHGEQVAANGTTFSHPSIAQVGNDVVIAVAGANNSMDLYWQVNGASGWNAETVAGNWTTYSAPSLAPDGTAVVIAAQGPSASLAFYWAASVTGGWNPEIVAGAGTTFSAPAETVNGNSVNIATEGPSDSLDFYWAVNGSPTWNPEVVAGAGSIGSAPAMVAQGGGVNIVARRYNTLGLVFYWAFNGSPIWTPSDLAGAEVGPQPAIVAYPGNPGGVHVVDTAGILGGVAEETIANGSGTWQSTTVCGGVPLHAGCESGAPTVTMNGGLVNIAVVGVNGDLDFWWQDSSGAWHQETVDTAANL